MKNIFQTAAIAMAMVFASCQSARDQQMEKIQSLEKALVEEHQGIIEPQLGAEMQSAYLDFAKNFPQDSLASKQLFKAAEVAQGLGEYEEALGILERIQSEFPQSKEAATALFLSGFITENHLNSPELAKTYYQSFITKYPNHPLAKDARILIEQAGLTDPRFLREFQN